MPINITALGGAGTHSLRRTNVNLQEDYIYYPNRTSEAVAADQELFPTQITNNSAWIWRETTGSLAGVETGTLYYTKTDGFSIAFATSENGTSLDLTEFFSGDVTFNFPYVLNGSFNISAVKYADRQAVKYVTTGTPVSGLTNNQIYYVKNLLTGLGGTSLYDFTSQTFTTGGTSGRYGPVVSQLRQQYVSAGAAWAGTYVNSGTYQGYQDWTVPEDGLYEITAKGAPGRQGNTLGGGGAIVKGRVRLFRGEIITIAVGQRGELPPNNLAWPASSGGTFVVRKNGNIPLMVAGGGASSSNNTVGFNAVLTNTGGTSQPGYGGGTDGNGAGGINAGGGGGGFKSAGGNSSVGGGGGGFNNGLVGGYRGGTSSGNGGFGGGGGSDGQSWGGSGGAGGYSGGRGVATQGSQSAGGGGSYIFPTATNVATSTGLYNGSSTFLGSPITNLSQYNTGNVEGSVDVVLVESSIYGFTLHPTALDADNDENAIAVSAAGGSYHSLVPVSYDTDGNTLNFVNAHGLVNGAAINYVYSGGSQATGINQDAVYYVERLNDYTVKLSSTPDPSFTTVDLLLPSAEATEQLRVITVNTATNSFTISNHAFLTGQPVRYSNGGGTNVSIAPLQNNSTYYVKDVIDTNRFTISQSLNGPAIDISSAGTGSNHSFIYIVLNIDEDSIYIPSHGYVSGQTVKYQKSRDFAITDLQTSGTSRYVTTTTPHDFQVNNRFTFDNLQRTTIATPAIQVTQISSSGQTRTITLASSHGMSTGHYIDVTGFTSTRDSRFNGLYMVTGTPTSNILTFTAEESVTIATENVGEVANIQRNTKAEYDKNSMVRDIRSIQSSGTTRTVTTQEPHRFTNGYPVTISDIAGEYGKYFNGTHYVTSTPSSNRFTFTGVFEDETRSTQKSANLTLADTPIISGTVYEEMVIDQILSSTRFRYQCSQSSFSTGLETGIVGRVSRTSVYVTGRLLTNRTRGQISTQSVHGLSVGDRFVTTNFQGNNNNKFNGTFTVTNVPNTTTVQFLAPDSPKSIESVRLINTTSATVNTSVSHDVYSSNYFYVNNVNGDDTDYWSGNSEILSVAATGGTARRIITKNPHKMSTGNRFRLFDIAAPGITASDWEGDWTVSSVNSATQFNYTATTSFTIAQTDVTAGKIQRANIVSSIPSYSINNRNRSGNVVTVNFTGNHDLVVNDRIRIQDLSGASADELMGDYVITAVPAANQIRYVTSSSGTIAAAGVSGTAYAAFQIRYSIPDHNRTIARRELLSHQIARYETQYAHDLAAGDSVQMSSISGNNSGVFTGTFNVSQIISPTVFTVTRTPQANVTTFTVTNRLRTANVADVTLNTTHNLQIGNTVTISNMTGNDASVFNGTFAVSAVPASNRIQFFTDTTGTINSSGASGSVTVDIIPEIVASGTMTLRQVPRIDKTAGSLSVSEISSTSNTANMSVDTEIRGLTNQQEYYVQRVDANTVRLSTNQTLTSIANITNVGIGSQQIVTTSINYDSDALTIPNHGFSLGELVEYDTQGGVAVGGLVTATPYYVILVDGNTIKLATSLSNAQNGTAVNLTLGATAPTGRHRLKSLIRTPDGTYTISNVPSDYSFQVTAQGQVPLVVKTFSPRFVVDLTSSTIKIPNHGFLTGAEITYGDGGETAIGGLTDNTHYYIVALNKDYLRLASSPANAEAGISLTLTSYGSGLSHTLTSAQISGQITGSGTVTTTSGAVLVTGAGTAFSKILKVGDRFRIFPPDLEVPSFFRSADVDTTTDIITSSTHGLVTGDAVVFGPGTGGPVRRIYQISSSGTTRTIITAEPHNYTTTNVVTISDLSSTSQDDFQGTYTITSTPNTYTFTYTAANSISLSTELQTTGTTKISGTAGVAPTPLISGYYYYVRAIPNDTVFTISARDRTSNVITFTTTVAHNLLPGNSFTVTNITGVNPEVFNGTFTVAQVPNTTQVRVISVGGNIGNAGVSATLTPSSSNTLTLHETPADAEANANKVDFSNAGSGFALTLTKVTPSSPIVRTISAIGSDTQITVDRPYSTAYTAIAYSYPTFVYVRPQGYSLHRPFDGGVEMSTGSGIWYGSIIRQTRKYFRYQSGKGIQTSAAVNFKPSIDIEEMKRIGVSNSISIRTRRPHGLVNGLFINVDESETSTGVLSTQYNGRFQVTVIDSFNLLVIANTTLTESRAHGYPRLHVEAWTNGAIRAGMFDFQNGMFYEFDGQKLYCVRRSSTQQIAGTCAVLKGSEFVFGTNTSFTSQLSAGDFIVLRGQTYKVSSVISDTRLTIKPEYKGSSGTEKEFDPATVVDTSTNTFTILSHGFSNTLPVVYNSIDGTPIGGLINSKTYYVSVISNNTFRLKATPEAGAVDVDISSVGSGAPHSFTPAKTGIIATLTVDTKIPQEDWSIDKCDGTGPTGYNLDLSKIQMIYIDYSWYGAGKIRFGFKTLNGQVQYTHEFSHNNVLYESYLRSGNLPARYEVTTFANPTYIPSLFHWGTSVIMDGKFDDDRAYLFSKSSPSLNIGGTTTKTFGSSAVNRTTDVITIPSHGFATGDAVSFTSRGTSGNIQANSQNPAIQVIDGQVDTNLQNEKTYFVRSLSANTLTLAPTAAIAEQTARPIANFSKSGWLVTVNTSGAHGFSTGQSVFTNISTTTNFNSSVNGSYTVRDTPNSTQYRYYAFVGNRDFGTQTPAAGNGIALRQMLNFFNSGNSQASYVLAPAGNLNNTSGTNYQPLLSIRLSPSVSEGLTGGLGDRDIINRMQLRTQEVGIQTNQLVDVRLLLNARLNNLNFSAVTSPSLVQTIDHTSNDTVSGGIQVYNFRASGSNGTEQTTAISIDELFELSNSILGGSSVYPDGPDVLTVAVARLTGSETLASAKLSWREAQA